MRQGISQRWFVNKTNPEFIDYVSRLVSVSPAFAQVLVNRGIKTSEQLNSFLSPDISRLSDPMELPDIKKALDRINEAKRLGERVLICGDYDADGVTATAIMLEGLKRFGLDADYFIPHRVSHGYGFGNAGLEKAKETGARLIITVDCGITSLDAVSQANALGIDVIVTDHHEPSFSLPDALAIINPKLLTHHSSLATLSGAGVAFMLVYALLGSIDEVFSLFDLAAIGTGADVVPIIGDNRIILKEGIKLIQSGERAGIKALKDAAGIKPDFFKTSFLYYVLVPRINAAGRIADANDVVRLLTTRSEAEAQGLAKRLHDLNAKRQEIEEAVYNDALEMLKNTDMNGAVVLAGEGWHIGVVGIVASRIAEEYNRPAFILSIENGIAKGSARSIPSFDIHQALTQCKDLLKRFGGHKQAAGLSVLTEDIGRFRNMMSDIVSQTLSDEDFVPVLNIDAAVGLSDISVSLVDEIAMLEPFGYGNDEPLFGARGLEAMQPRVVGNNHLKMRLKQKGRSIDCIGFDFGGMLNTIEENAAVDAAFIPAINEWNGGRYLQLNLKAIRPAAG
jgi:single-stranded-DNA-specific exonuclease